MKITWIIVLSTLVFFTACRTGRVAAAGVPDGVATEPPLAPPLETSTTDELMPDEPDEEGEGEELQFVEIPPHASDVPESSFAEIWGYVVAGKEQSLKVNYPLSDVVYFGAEIDRYGRLTDVPQRKALAGFPGRVHLAVVCNSSGLTHFVIEPASKTREQLVRDLIAATADYDGLNIDFELVPGRDGDAFRSLLSDLRAGLNNKLLSVALPARTRTISDDVYNYPKIVALVDRIFIMAYDEHWSGSSPGPVASMNWCKTVAAYSLKAIGSEKLIMGLPFYGRGWGNASTSRALIFPTTESLKKERGVSEIHRENGIPTFTYDITVRVTVYYEDAYSLAMRAALYREQGVRSIGFWSIGQEDVGIWSLLKIE
jgi:hypothetical protein